MLKPFPDTPKLISNLVSIMYDAWVQGNIYLTQDIYHYHHHQSGLVAKEHASSNGIKKFKCNASSNNNNVIHHKNIFRHGVVFQRHS